MTVTVATKVSALRTPVNEGNGDVSPTILMCNTKTLTLKKTVQTKFVNGSLN
jgi:hypothetical protein